MQRKYLTGTQRVNAPTPASILHLWESKRVKGRVAILFTRRLNAIEPQKDDKQLKYLETAINKGIIRKVYHYIPDSMWSGASENLSKMKQQARPADKGYAVFFPGGRVHVMPFSELQKTGEIALVVIEPEVWNTSELDLINRRIKDGSLPSDLVAVLSK